MRCFRKINPIAYKNIDLYGIKLLPLTGQALLLGTTPFSGSEGFLTLSLGQKVF